MLSTQRVWCAVAAMHCAAAAATAGGTRHRSPSTCTRTPWRSTMLRSYAARHRSLQANKLWSAHKRVMSELVNSGSRWLDHTVRMALIHTERRYLVHTRDDAQRCHRPCVTDQCVLLVLQHKASSALSDPRQAGFWFGLPLLGQTSSETVLEHLQDGEQLLLGEVHEDGDLFGAAIEVLQAEGVHAHAGHPQLQAPLQRLDQLRIAETMWVAQTLRTLPRWQSRPLRSAYA